MRFFVTEIGSGRRGVQTGRPAVQGTAAKGIAGFSYSPLNGPVDIGCQARRDTLSTGSDGGYGR